MGNNFKKFKQRVRRGAVISAVLLGFGVGIAATSLLALVLKLTGATLNPLYYALGAMVSAVLTLVLYLIFMPDDKRLAKKLDLTYSLDEKISTMVEFKDVDSVFAQLQREDADERLGTQPPKLMRSPRLISAVLVFALSVGCMAGAIIVPAKAEAGEAPIGEFDKQWILTALEELLLTVNNSYMADSLKETSREELNSLIAFVKGTDMMSEMKAEAIKTVNNISDALAKINSASAIGAAMSASSNEHIAAIGKELCELTGTGTRKALADFADSFEDTSYDDISFFADEINACLAASGVRTDDTLHIAFKRLTAEMKTESKSKLVESFESTGKEISPEIIAQNVNDDTVSGVNTRLCELFGISKDELNPNAPVDDGNSERDPSLITPDDPEVDEPDVDIGSGGLGTGDVVYGSDDQIFDPDKNTYVPYGDMFNDYFAKANEQIVDGRTDDEISDAAESYFGTLLSGAKKDN